MFLIKGKTITGKTVIFNNPISLAYDADRYIPCDSLDFSCELQCENDEFCEVSVFIDNSLLFNGIVDRQTISISDKGRFISMRCRNKTALMIDNEIKPCFYYQLTSEQLFSKYAKPFGIVCADFPYSAKQNFIQIKKGSSNFTMLSEYCRLVYKKIPYITRANTITLNPLNQKLHIISNSTKNSLNYSSISIKQLNDKIISKLYMKTATDYYGDFYGATFDNANAQKKHIARERFYNPTNIVALYKEAETKQILEESNRDSFVIEVTLPYIKNMDIGDCVKLVEDKLFYDNLYISKMSYVISPTAGKITKLYLRDKKYA